MKPRHIELPSLESLPQTVCIICERSLINGLFTPIELARQDRSPRCRKCCGDLSDYFRRKNKPGHPWGGTDPAL